MASETFELSPGTERAAGIIELPAPTAWPIILAFGLTLVFTGLVTSASVSILGTILTIAGFVGWFHDVLPHEKHESEPVVEKVPTVATSRPHVARVQCKTQELRQSPPPADADPRFTGIHCGPGGTARLG